MVGIKDMEMPTSCESCELTYEDDYLRDRCIRTGNYVGDCIKERRSNCPLIEIDGEKKGKKK